MSRIHAMSLLVVVLLLSSLCFTHAKQIKAKSTPWSIHISKPGGGTRSLAFEHIWLPHGVTGAESLAFDSRGRGPYAGVSDGRILKWDSASPKAGRPSRTTHATRTPPCARRPRIGQTARRARAPTQPAIPPQDR